MTDMTNITHIPPPPPPPRPPPPRPPGDRPHPPPPPVRHRGRGPYRLCHRLAAATDGRLRHPGGRPRPDAAGQGGRPGHRHAADSRRRGLGGPHLPPLFPPPL